MRHHVHTHSSSHGTDPSDQHVGICLKYTHCGDCSAVVHSSVHSELQGHDCISMQTKPSQQLTLNFKAWNPRQCSSAGTALVQATPANASAQVPPPPAATRGRVYTRTNAYDLQQAAWTYMPDRSGQTDNWSNACQGTSHVTVHQVSQGLLFKLQ